MKHFILILLLTIMMVSMPIPSFAVNEEMVTVILEIDGVKEKTTLPMTTILEETMEEKKLELQTIKVQEAVEEIIQIPTWTWPTPNTRDISYGFGYRWHPVYGGSDFHNGIDILGDWSDDIVAAKDGKVILAGWYGGYGECVIIQHEDNIQTLYGHGSSILVNEGDKVYIGDSIMEMGNSGTSSAVHLHFSVSIDGEWVDPLNYVE